MSGLLGLRLLALLRGDDTSGSGWWWDNVAPAIEVFATGLVIGAGSKPLHDLISRLDKNTTEKKRADADSGRPPIPPPPVPPGGTYRQAVVVDARSGTVDAAQLRATVAKLLPDWSVSDVGGSYLVHHVTAACRARRRTSPRASRPPTACTEPGSTSPCRRRRCGWIGPTPVRPGRAARWRRWG